MDRLSTEQRVLIVQTYYGNGRSVKNTFRQLRTSFGIHGRPSEPGIRKIIARFESTGSVAGVTPYKHVRPVRSRHTNAFITMY